MTSRPRAPTRRRNPNGQPAHGYGKPDQPGHWFEVKTIKGHAYLYECWRDETGKKHSVYQGKAMVKSVKRTSRTVQHTKRAKRVPAR